MRHASFHIIMNPWLETRVCGYVDTVGEDVPGKLMEIETNYDHYIVRAATSGRVTASHPNSEVKLPRVSVVLRWGTTREGDMLHVPFFLKHPPPKAVPSENSFKKQVGNVALSTKYARSRSAPDLALYM